MSQNNNSKELDKTSNMEKYKKYVFWTLIIIISQIVFFFLQTIRNYYCDSYGLTTSSFCAYGCPIDSWCIIYASNYTEISIYVLPMFINCLLITGFILLLTKICIKIFRYTIKTYVISLFIFLSMISTIIVVPIYHDMYWKHFLSVKDYFPRGEAVRSCPLYLRIGFPVVDIKIRLRDTISEEDTVKYIW